MSANIRNQIFNLSEGSSGEIVTVSYDAASEALFARMVTAGDDPQSGEKAAIDTLIRGLKTNTLFDSRFDAFWVTKGIARASSRLNWIQNLYNLTEEANGGTVGWTTKVGFSSDGTASYLKTGFTHDNKVKFLQSNASFGFKNSGINDNSGFNGHGVKSTNGCLISNVFGGQWMYLNSYLKTESFARAIGYNCLARNDGSTLRGYINSNDYSDAGSTVSGMSGLEMYLCAMNDSGSVVRCTPSTEKLEMAFIGAYISKAEFLIIQGLFNDYITAINAL